MKLSVGIVGLPNVGKSTLFNAITESAVEAQNYPFCTIEPNVGIVEVPDARVNALSQLSESEKTVFATIEFVDIAGLVEGASAGEGLGNKFLSHIRDVAVIAHVVRCFEDDNITHVHGRLSPVDDIQIINTELILADLQQAQNALEAAKKKAKGNKEDDINRAEVLSRVVDHLGSEKPVRTLDLSDEERVLLKDYQFLTQKKVIYVGNVGESELGQGTDRLKEMAAYATQSQDPWLEISAKIESEISQLDPTERGEFLESMGIQESGLNRLAKACFDLLGLQTFLTTGPKETRSWPIKIGTTAPKAAGTIHTDFESGFIRANIVSYPDLMKFGGVKQAREQGHLRQEGKEYIMQPDDVVEFLFNV